MTMPICCCLMELLDTMQKEEVIAPKAVFNIVQVGSLLSTAAVILSARPKGRVTILALL